MAKLLQNSRVRGALFNVPILLVFVTAWISDRWPDLTAPAIGIALVVAVAELTVVYFAGTRISTSATTEPRRSPGIDSALKAIQDSEGAGKSGADEWAIRAVRAFALSSYPGSYSRSLYYRMYRVAIQDHLLSARIRELELPPQKSDARATAAMAHYQMLESLLISTNHEARLRRPRELERWSVSTMNQDVFHIAAGAFEIEYFHGYTNIRVLDATRLTVESALTSKPESPNDQLDLGLCPPTYH